MQLLHVDSSILGEASASRALSAAIVDAFRRKDPEARVIYRDLVADPISHLNGGIAAGFRPISAGSFDEDTLAEHAYSDVLVGELLASDMVVIGAPMYNFSVASQLKAWIDRVVQPGRTFRYTPQGPIGLASGKKIVVASTRGGVYSEGPAASMDFQEAYLKAVFGFLGITDVQFVRAERLSRGDEARQQAMQSALDAAHVLTETLPA